MTAVLPTHTASIRWSARAEPWILCAGLVVMYGPTLVDLLNGGLWSTGEHSHGPVMLVTSLVLMWKRWTDTRPALQSAPNIAWAWPMLVVGALLFVSGRSLGIIHLEVGSAIIVIAGCILMLHGVPALKALRFPLFFMIFMVPLPGFALDPISEVMKTAVSQAAEHVLRGFGYPIARSGVVLQVGQYQLLVADACAGMRTLLMLEAFGILYLNVVRHSSIVRNVGLATLIVPISFAANVVRVIVLALVTFHLGDEAGQGFLHGFAGMVLFVSALALTVAADRLLRVPRDRKIAAA